MKIRMKGNSIRLRLSKTEVNKLHNSGTISDQVNFPQEKVFHYKILSDNSNSINASYSTSCMLLSVPTIEVTKWATSDQTSLIGEVEINGESVLKILIEKDFACLTVRDGEDESDLFPNPNETC